MLYYKDKNPYTVSSIKVSYGVWWSKLNIQYYWGTLILLICLSVLLCACSKKVPKPNLNPTIQQIRHAYIRQLRMDGVQVISLGETMRFVLLSDHLFKERNLGGMSPSQKRWGLPRRRTNTGKQSRSLAAELLNVSSANIQATYKPVLIMLAKLINTYDKVNVKVAAYTDNRGNPERQRALTTRQAQVIASYLWSCGIDARLEYAVGLGRHDSVGWNGNAHGRYYNRRVEISFHYYPQRIPYA